MTPIYEDNHIIVVCKEVGEIVQGDKTGDTPLVEIVKQYIKEKYAKPGNVFTGVVHRLDRPVSGLVIFAKTSKALARLNRMLAERAIHKTYWAIVEGKPEQLQGRLVHYISTVERNNKSYASDKEKPGTKRAELTYRTLAVGDRYSLLEVNLITGRKHQIRVQLSAIGHPIKGDLKYGARRSNPDGGISLCARVIDFEHPVSREQLHLEAPLPSGDTLWTILTEKAGEI